MLALRMVVTDLDRTLLHDDKTISEYSAGVFARCRAAGIKIVFATARPLRAASPYCSQIICDALICHNGSHVLAGNICVDRKAIPFEVVRDLLDKISVQLPGIHMACEIDDVLYANFDAFRLWKLAEFVRTDFRVLPPRPADKVIIDPESPRQTEVIKSLLPSLLYAQISENQLCLIMHKEATKAHAVRAVAAHFDIPLLQIAAFGDDLNDIEMLRECGMGIAVENAISEAKMAADEICADNAHDGVAAWLLAYLEDL